MAAEPTPPAWLRSYKAQSAIIPNFASQVKPDAESRQKPVVGGNPFGQFGQDKAAEQKQIETESAFSIHDLFDHPQRLVSGSNLLKLNPKLITEAAIIQSERQREDTPRLITEAAIVQSGRLREDTPKPDELRPNHSR
ncbi:MAG: hypothetical protein LQ350_001117 [Teloschistes chrysophthalmus]|nr:MAG: hypothetical protein LQ350_001117 [Niorma chrysophthalma]